MTVKARIIWAVADILVVAPCMFGLITTGSLIGLLGSFLEFFGGIIVLISIVNTPTKETK
jgi:hypothetical protein